MVRIHTKLIRPSFTLFSFMILMQPHYFGIIQNNVNYLCLSILGKKRYVTLLFTMEKYPIKLKNEFLNNVKDAFSKPCEFFNLILTLT